jgi:hypothetical protein
MDVSDTEPASVEELLGILVLVASPGSIVVVELTTAFVVGILDFMLPLLRRFGSDSSPGWLARFLPLPLIGLRVLLPVAFWSTYFEAPGFLRAGCRRLVALRRAAAVSSTAGGARAFGACASEVPALMAVNPAMVIEMVLIAQVFDDSDEAACHVLASTSLWMMRWYR